MIRFRKNGKTAEKLANTDFESNFCFNLVNVIISKPTYDFIIITNGAF